MFFWRASTFLDALQKFLPETFRILQGLAGKIGTRQYQARLRRDYAQLENISVDYAILERNTAVGLNPRVFVIPAGVGWSDIGSWGAVYELLARSTGANVFSGEGHAFDASGNFVSCNDKFVAAIGVKDLVVVDTADALLICPRERAQDVGKIVKWLEQNKIGKLL